ncbi:S-layer-like array protein [Solidesulfovibrio carbinoliphilus subsp. oakridgensis]|uniref:S-layer-like array protein n=1 Tax=Solidesulfovibrio carbinoliphilus subsp. oakridgensis TaxID=694327 RepID=G7Q5K1_9BACT|nr:hypothetical protein [Solidesulfovibrio carbinoliphilus]EHJ49560.1 S-layer-like array protein [Solidesulfovibrio carbinoliphilus subsp. oakridgensis]
MTTIITTSGHPVRLDPVHYILARPEDVAEQQAFAALAEAGREDEVFRRLDAARTACVGRIEARRIGGKAV